MLVEIYSQIITNSSCDSQSLFFLRQCVFIKFVLMKYIFSLMTDEMPKRALCTVVVKPHTR